MQSLSDVSFTDFQQALTPSAIRVSKIIHFAMAAGLIMFGLVVAYVYSQTEVEPDSDFIPTLDLLSIIHVAITVSTWTVGKFIFDRQFLPQNLQASLIRPMVDQEGRTIELTPAQRCVSLIRTAFILRLTLFEAPAFVGLAIAMLSVVNGVAKIEPAYLFNMASAVVAIGFIGITFPSAELYEKIFQDKFKGSHITAAT